MCRSVLEGGLRCAAHTRPAFQAATPGTREWDTAAAAYASTREGAARLSEERDAADIAGNVERATALNTALTAGARNREIAVATWAEIQRQSTPDRGPSPSSYRNYYADDAVTENTAPAFTSASIGNARTAARRDGQAYLSVTRPVTGSAVVIHEGHGAGYTVENDPATSHSLRCDCPDYRANYRCRHIDATLAAIQSRLNQDRVSEGHVNLAIAEREHFDDTGTATQDGVVNDGVTYADNPAAFQEAYRAARARAAAGENPIEYMTENATNGLGSPDGGRGFGVELEFDVDDRSVLPLIARDLHAAGLTPTARQTGYHSDRTVYTRHQGGWKFEQDCTVSGEIISPKMYDTPETWNNLAKVCEIIERHGGTASVRAGSHIHISAGDYRPDGSDHSRLLQTFSDNEDLMYRMASNPDRGTHRRLDNGTDWSRPNQVPGANFTSLADARRSAAHHNAVNLEGCSGRSTDHVEFRMWDSTLKPANIQAQIKMSLGLTEAAHRDTTYTPTGNTPVGSRRRHNRETFGENRRLRGDDWNNDTQTVRNLTDRLFTRAEDKAQMASLFAATKWQFKSRRRRTTTR